MRKMVRNSPSLNERDAKRQIDLKHGSIRCDAEVVQLITRSDGLKATRATHESLTVRTLHSIIHCAV